MKDFYDKFIKWFLQLQKETHKTYNFSLSKKFVRVYKNGKTYYYVEVATGDVYTKHKVVIGSILSLS